MATSSSTFSQDHPHDDIHGSITEAQWNHHLGDQPKIKLPRILGLNLDSHHTRAALNLIHTVLALGAPDEPVAPSDELAARSNEAENVIDKSITRKQRELAAFDSKDALDALDQKISHAALQLDLANDALKYKTRKFGALGEMEQQRYSRDFQRSQLALKQQQDALDVLGQKRERVALELNQRLEALGFAEADLVAVLPTIVPLPPAVNYTIAGRNAKHSKGALPHHHAVISESSVRLLTAFGAIWRKKIVDPAALTYPRPPPPPPPQQVQAQAQSQASLTTLGPASPPPPPPPPPFNSFRALDQTACPPNDSSLYQLQKSRLVRICGEAGLGKSTTLPLAFARALRDPECKYPNIALTYHHPVDDGADGTGLAVRVTHNHLSGWTAEQLDSPTAVYSIPDDTLHFMDITEVYGPADMVPPDKKGSQRTKSTEHYPTLAWKIDNAAVNHKNSKTIVVSPILEEMTFDSPTSKQESFASLRYCRIPPELRTPSPVYLAHAPLVYSAQPSYPAHFATYIQSTLLRRFGVTCSLGVDSNGPTVGVTRSLSADANEANGATRSLEDNMATIDLDPHGLDADANWSTVDVDPHGVHDMLQGLRLPFYQQYFPVDPFGLESTPSNQLADADGASTYRLHSGSFLSFSGLPLQGAVPPHWYKGPDSTTEEVNAVLRNLSVDEAHQQRLERFDRLVLKISLPNPNSAQQLVQDRAQARAHGDSAPQAMGAEPMGPQQKQNTGKDALGWIEARLQQASEEQAHVEQPQDQSKADQGKVWAEWVHSRSCLSQLEGLYYDLQATLPWDEFEAMLKAGVYKLGCYAPNMRAMQHALCPVPSDRDARVRATNMRIADDVNHAETFFCRAQGYDTYAAPPLLIDSPLKPSHAMHHVSSLSGSRRGSSKIQWTVLEAYKKQQRLDLTVPLRGQLVTFHIQHVLQMFDAPKDTAPWDKSPKIDPVGYFTVQESARKSDLAKAFRTSFPSPPLPGHCHVLLTPRFCNGSGGYIVANPHSDTQQTAAEAEGKAVSALDFIAFEAQGHLHKNDTLYLKSLNYADMAFFATTLEAHWYGGKAPKEPNTSDADSFRRRFVAHLGESELKQYYSHVATSFLRDFVTGDKAVAATARQKRKLDQRMNIAKRQLGVTGGTSAASASQAEGGAEGGAGAGEASKASAAPETALRASITNALQARWGPQSNDGKRQQDQPDLGNGDRQGQDLVKRQEQQQQAFVPSFVVVQTVPSPVSLNWADACIGISGLYHPHHDRRTNAKLFGQSWLLENSFHTSDPNDDSDYSDDDEDE